MDYVKQNTAAQGLGLAPPVKQKGLALSDIQQVPFLSLLQQLGLERSIFEPLRFIDTFQGYGRELPDRLAPIGFNSAPAVSPGPAFIDASGWLNRTYGQTSELPAFLASGFASGPDPSDIDPSTGQPVDHQPSRFKTMASPTRFLPPSVVAPQMSIPFNANGMAFDTRREMFSPYAVAPSSDIVDMYHQYDELLNQRQKKAVKN